jgi:16S rRNA (guanine527-N7)-methyltransferase
MMQDRHARVVSKYAPMTLDRLARRYRLSADQVAQLQRLAGYIESDPHAPTGPRARAAAVDVHLADSLVGLEVEPLIRARRVTDIGSGAGFPGIPLAVALPAATVSLVESQSRRCVFLELAVATTGATNVAVVSGRVEEWRQGRGLNDAVVARAVAQQAVVLEYAAPLLRVGGALVDWRGKRSPREEEQAVRAAEELGLERHEIRGVRPYSAAEDHYLHLYFKVRETPERFPRRAGVARRRPLGLAR